MVFKIHRICAQSPFVLSQVNDVKEHENGFQYKTDHPAGNPESKYSSVLLILDHHLFSFIALYCLKGKICMTDVTSWRSKPDEESQSAHLRSADRAPDVQDPPGSPVMAPNLR